MGIQINDEFDTEGFGNVRVTDIFISPTTQERVYEIKIIGDERDYGYLVRGAELQ